MLTRRELLRAFGVAGAGALLVPNAGRWSQAWAQTLPTGVEFDPPPFTLGVASGYPTTNSVVLWTRLAPEPLTADGGLQAPIDVAWAVATTPEGVTAGLGGNSRKGNGKAGGNNGGGGSTGDVVASGSVPALAERGHSVHIDVGGLQPGGTYFYGFAADGVHSVVGRTRTAPAGPTQQLRFGVASCQHFGQGLWPALGHLAAEDIDFVLHVGDYIYEGGGTGQGRSHIGGTLQTPADYRIRHALYKGDPNLRAAHARHPWILTWDDHEVANNYAGPHRPGNVEQLRTGAYKAYYEHLPIRLTPEGPPDGPWFRIYQQAVFGDLLDVVLTDTRQYRDIQPCQGEDLPCFETHPYHPDRTILGAAQKAWLKDVLASSTTAWRALAISTPFTTWQIGGLPQEAIDPLVGAGLPVFDKAHFNEDVWESYVAERQELLGFILDQNISDVVALSGEGHRHFWSHVRLDIDNPLSPVVLSEFAGTAISSNNGDPDENDARPAIYASSKHIRYMDADNWGYMLCDVTPQRWRTTARTIVHSQNPGSNPRTDPNASIFDSAVFEVLRGDPTLHHVAGPDANPIPDLL